MTSDLDIWRTAATLVLLHGERAAFVAAERADDLFAAEDFVGAAVFTRVMRVILDLERKKPREGDTVN